MFSTTQKTSTCCPRTGNPGKRRRVWWGNKWSMLPTREWREPAWSSTRSQPNPLSTTSNMMMTFISMSMTWSKPPRNGGQLILFSGLHTFAFFPPPHIVITLLPKASAGSSRWHALFFSVKEVQSVSLYAQQNCSAPMLKLVQQVSLFYCCCCTL